MEQKEVGQEEKEQAAYENGLKLSAIQYAEASMLIKHATAVKKQAEADLERAREQLIRFGEILCKSVDPRCGSATKPYRRVYRAPDFPAAVVIVQWDDKFSRGVVTYEMVQ